MVNDKWLLHVRGMGKKRKTWIYFFENNENSKLVGAFRMKCMYHI